jgi:hypothetical protein
MVEETGAVLLVVRLKVNADKLTELELVATRSRGEGLIFNIDGLSAPSAGMNYAPRPAQLATRDAATKAALSYPEGLTAAKTLPPECAFAPDAYRYENGQVMAGPIASSPGCQNISTQSLAIFQLGDAQTRIIAVDERMGIVLLRMAWGVRERGGDQLTVGRRSRSTTARSTPWKRSCGSCRGEAQRWVGVACRLARKGGSDNAENRPPCARVEPAGARLRHHRYSASFIRRRL